MQSWNLETKIQVTQTRILEWYKHYDGNVYVSFSGGKDSTVLLDLVRRMFPDVEAVYCDTGLEYPEIREFVKTLDNITWIKPKKNFKQVIKENGYPVISKEQALYIYEYKNTKSDKLRDKRWNGDEKGSFKISEKWKFLVDAPFKISNNCCYTMKKVLLNVLKKQLKRNHLLEPWQKNLRLEKMHGLNMVVILLKQKDLRLNLCHSGQSKIFLNIYLDLKSLMHLFMEK